MPRRVVEVRLYSLFNLFWRECGNRKAISIMMYVSQTKIRIWFILHTLLKCYFLTFWVGIARSVQRLATGWTTGGSNSCRGEIFCARRDPPWGPPSLLCNGYRVSFTGVKQPVRGFDHPPPSSAEGKERVGLYLCVYLGLQGLL